MSNYIGNVISRSELVQQAIVDVILEKRRRYPKLAHDSIWDLKHSASIVQIGRMLAQKRKLNVELVEVMCALHDVYVCKTGKREEHAHRGAPIAAALLKKTWRFTAREIALITKAIDYHSDKHLVSRDPYVELVKDADLFDWSLYEGSHNGIVRKYKDPTPYFARIKRIRKELNLPKDPQWDRLVIL